MPTWQLSSTGTPKCKSQYISKTICRNSSTGKIKDRHPITDLIINRKLSNCSVYMDGEEYINLDTIFPVKSFIHTSGPKVKYHKMHKSQNFHLEYRENFRKLNLIMENIQRRISIFKWLLFG